MPTAFYILTRQPSATLLRFADDLAEFLDVTIVSDEMPSACPERAAIVHIDDETCRSAGFFNASPNFKKTPIAWDKAFYLMESEHCDHYWCCEDDVLFLDVEDVIGLVQRYEKDDSDLLCRHAFSHRECPRWVHWRHGANFAEEERMAAFLPLCRISRSLASAVATEAMAGRMVFFETLLPSLARRLGLTIKAMPDIRTRAFRNCPALRRSEVVLWSILFGRRIFHPIKDLGLREKLMRRSPWLLAVDLPCGAVLALSALLLPLRYGVTRRIRRLIRRPPPERQRS